MFSSLKTYSISLDPELDPDPNLAKILYPDPNSIYLDPQHCYEEWEMLLKMMPTWIFSLRRSFKKILCPYIYYIFVPILDTAMKPPRMWKLTSSAHPTTSGKLLLKMFLKILISCGKFNIPPSVRRTTFFMFKQFSTLMIMIPRLIVVLCSLVQSFCLSTVDFYSSW